MTIRKTIPVCSVLFFVISCFTAFAQDTPARPDATIIQQHINILAADKMKGRGTGSKGLKKAARYIERQYKKYGLSPAGIRKYQQPFIARIKKVVVKDSLRKANNIIGFLDNKAPYTIVIGAHYDHLGTGEQGGSKHPEPEGLIHNGADDNASGVAGLLELARYFSGNGETEPYNFLFIAFSGEELGLLGSKYFVEHSVLPLKDIHFMLNMDMIGRYNPERGIGIGGYGTSSDWPSVFEDVKAGVKFFTDNAGSGGSDHGSFYARQVPVLFFHTGGHPDYHMPSDDADKVNAEAEAKIIELEIQIIENAMKREKLPFTEVKG